MYTPMNLEKEIGLRVLVHSLLADRWYDLPKLMNSTHGPVVVFDIGLPSLKYSNTQTTHSRGA